MFEQVTNANRPGNADGPVTQGVLQACRVRNEIGAFDRRPASRVMSIAVLLTACLAAPPVWTGPPVAPQLPCPTGSDISHRHLLGLWRASFEGLSQGATLLLEQHPELAESVSGAIRRGDEKALLAGDLNDGELSLEESNDGIHIGATWSGVFIDGVCGTEIHGDWQAAGDAVPRAFVLRRLP